MAEKTILIADDDHGVLELLEEILRKEGYRVLLAPDGRQALDTIGRHPVDMAIIDMKMPGLDGLETIKRIRASYPSVIILVMTGYGDIEDLRETILEHGAYDYLLKLVKKEEIVKYVKDAFLKHEFGSRDHRLKKEIGERLEKLERELEERTLQLRELQITQRLILENSNDIILLLQEGRLKFINPKLASLTGYSEEELQDLPFEELVHPEDRPLLSSILEQLNKDRISSSHPLRLLTRDGPALWGEMSAVRTTWETRPAILGFIRDITQTRNSEEALRAAEKKFLDLADQPPNMIFINQRGRVVFANKRCEEVMGYSKEEFYAEDFDFLSLIAPDSRHLVEQNFQRHMSGEEIVPYEYSLITKEGRRIEALINTKIIEYGGTPCILGIVTDITERKRAEVALRESEEKYRNILESIEDGYYEVDLVGNFIFFNESFASMVGLSEDELKGMNYRELTDKVQSERVYEVFNKVHTSGQPVKGFYWELSSREGTRRCVELSISVVRDTTGTPCGFRGIARDVTEKKRLEAQLQQAQKMEAIGTLAGGIAHDFNNLLMGIQGYTSLMLLNMDPGHPHFERLKAIERHVQSGAKLTGQLLRYARKGRYEVRPFQLNKVVEETLETFGRTRKDITIRRQLAKELPLIEGDMVQIEQVLFNLYINAADAMPGGGELMVKTEKVHSLISKAPGSEKGAAWEVLLTVSDTGVGMDPETLDRIFDPFFTTKERGRGTGLGLASVYGIIQAHGGRVDVSSRKGSGSCFYIYLPASSAKLEGRGISRKILKGKETILLVDDEEEIVLIGEQLLKELGYRVITATSGRDALEIYASSAGRIDLVILDLVMPGMSGGETFERVKELDPNVRVLLSSGYSIDRQADDILRRGCKGFIQKPFDLVTLSQKLRETIEQDL